MTIGQMPAPRRDSLYLHLSTESLSHFFRPRRSAPSVSAHADSALPIFAVLFAMTLVVVATWSPLLPAPMRSTANAVHAAFFAIAPNFLLASQPKSPFAVEQTPSIYDAEQEMTSAELINRWEPLIAQASARFGVPESWIRAVIRQESGGRMMTGENRPITSHAGAMGLMQLMPKTYKGLRAQLGLGRNPYAPYNNITAGTAYLRELHARYGYPAMFAAYNDGPGNYERSVADGTALPAETQHYLVAVAGSSPVRSERHRSSHRRVSSIYAG